jgi:acyl dehydratase
MRVVHGEQDMHFHQPLVPGMALETTAAAESIRVGGSGTRLIVKIDSRDEQGQPVLTQFVTTFIRGMADGESAGPDKPAHDFPDDARSRPLGRFVIHVDDDQTFRYADASGDRMPIHLDDDFAKSVGLPGIINHGLCTMAMCSQAVVKKVADGDPGRLRRLAVRFAANVLPGADIAVDLFDAGSDDGRQAVAFEASSGGQIVIKNGRAEVDR